jgi:protein required for attachment to host cells
MQLPANTHVALADGEKFLLMRNAGSAIEPRLELVTAPDLELENQSAAIDHNDPKNDDYRGQMKLDHAAAVADWLNRAVLQHEIDKLVVVAAPDTLGEMRQHYHKETQGVVVEEIAKHLINMPAPEILKVIEAA